MLTILVADIFGNTVALQQLAKQLATKEFLIIDAYAGQMINFNNEQTAYEYFNHHVGLRSYAQQLQKKLVKIKQPFNLIAFSVGGSALWLNAKLLKTTKVNRVVCFYAAQIRHHLERQPTVTIELVLPTSEPHFDMGDLKNRLSTKPNVIINQSEYLHGFMNQLSVNYDALGFQQYLTMLQAQFSH